MMKICVILLVITSVVAAGGIFSPHEGKKKNPKNDDLIVKESHRLIVVEYERETTEFRNPNHHHHHHHHPQQQLHHESASRSQHHHHRKEEDKEDKPLEHGLSAASSMLGRSNERLKDSMPDLRQGSRKRRSESLSSDAYQKSKDRVLYKTPDVREAIDEVERAEETSHQAKEKVMNKAHDAKEEVMDKTHDTNEAVEGSDAKRIPEAVHHVKDNVLGKTHDMKKDAVEDSDGLNQDKGKVSEKPHNVNEALGDSGETAAGYIKGMPEILNQAREKVSDKVHSVKEAFEDARDTLSESVKETASNVKEKAKEKIAVKSHVLKQSAEELILPDEKEKASQDSEGLIKMAQEIIINRVHGIKEGAGNIKESLNEFFVEDLKEKVRMTKSAITDKRSAHQKITMLFKEGSRNFTNVFQSGWEMAVSDANIKWGLGVIRLVGYGTAYGSSVWVSFVFSHLLARVLPRQQFAAARSKIYPAYFRLIGYSIGSSMVAQILRRRYESAQTKYKKGEKIHAYDLHMALVFVLVNLLFLEPRATKLGELNHRLEKMKWGREEGRGIHGPSETQVTSRTRTTVSEDVTEEIVTERSHEEKVEKRVRERANNELGELNQRLEKLNKYSAFFNILTIMTLTWHITFLAQCLYVSC
ncbi:hypothetical protein MKW98_003939 [Papaver atlanticum]|uniref:TMEM205-like domain-containing protein n=1 Tax=Papaver atlanticum TaxID=357466 RepID=A0AAD4SLS5_9MAGN|nr:hypothetical protein MKW98_003939 [Papaver atlanticum]